MPKSRVPNVLIVENQSGNVYIVENKGGTSQVEKILRNSDRRENNSIRSFPAQSEEVMVEEYLDEEYLQQLTDQEIVIKDGIKEENPVHFNVTDSNDQIDDTVLKDHPYTIAEHEIESFNILHENDVEFDEEFIIYDPDTARSNKKQYHKTHQLTGKAACKYCETVFKSKEIKKAHDCPYLQCDPRNFICRICKKELSKKTFSNHLHETLNCQYCDKGFLNPRNLSTHIRKIHKDEAYVDPPAPKIVNDLKEIEVVDDLEHLDEETGMIVRNVTVMKKPKKKYPRKTGRFECDLCGRILKTSKSLSTHMMLHTQLYRYVCETCGERFTTRTGIVKHACLNRKRRRPLTDFRTVDVRHCKYCDEWFASLEENKEHECMYQSQDDPKIFRCRFCNMDMSKNSYNKHMMKHLDTQEYICGLCDKRLANESSLQVHLSVHSGDKSYKCDKCDKCFINKILLTRHSRFHGNEIPIFKCEICNREVASKYHLKTHYETMHGDAYTCKLCKEVLTSRDKLKEHYKDSHKPYTCDICHKSFILQRYLNMHSKTHTNVSTQVYKCPYCERKFSKRAIANHIFKAHRDNFDDWRDQNMDLI